MIIRKMTKEARIDKGHNMARIVFMTPPFAIPLERMVAEHDVVAVYSQPPRPSGRGMKVRVSAVHARAEELSLNVETPARLDDVWTPAACA